MGSPSKIKFEIPTRVGFVASIRWERRSSRTSRAQWVGLRPEAQGGATADAAPPGDGEGRTRPACRRGG